MVFSDREFKYQVAANHVKQGGILAYPTEAVWGLGCDPFNFQAVLHLLELKRRPIEKGLIIVASNMEQIKPLLISLSSSQRKKLSASWPGPHTWLIPNNGSIPDWITGNHQKVAVRVSAHPVVVKLCEMIGGPIVSTSANLSGKPPAKSPLTVRRYFNSKDVKVLNGPLGGETKPSTITDLVTGKKIRE